MMHLNIIFVLKGIKADKYVDNRIISRMGSCATDFLVFFGVASIKIPVVIEYAVPVACVQGNWIAAVTPILIYLAALCIAPVVFKWWHKHPGKVWDESEL